MRNFLIVLLLGFAVYSKSQQPIETVLKCMTDQESAWNRVDWPGFMEHYWKHDSLKFIGSKGVTYGWQRIFENYRKGFPDKAAMGTLKFTIIEAKELAYDAVYVIGKFELAREKPISGHFTLMWRKIDGKWVIVWDHTS
jgi:ketosteroid isomerase-like protein